MQRPQAVNPILEINQSISLVDVCLPVLSAWMALAAVGCVCEKVSCGRVKRRGAGVWVRFGV